jgi:hypothetical protein
MKLDFGIDLGTDLRPIAGGLAQGVSLVARHGRAGSSTLETARA